MFTHTHVQRSYVTAQRGDVNSADSQLKDLSNIGVELAGIFRERVMLGQVISSIAKPKELGSLVQLNGELKETRRLESLVEYLKTSITAQGSDHFNYCLLDRFMERSVSNHPDRH